MKQQLKKLAKKIKDPWLPQEVAVVDGHHAYLCLFKGDFVMHRHPGDELFLCLDGEFEIETPEGTFAVKPGETFLVKSGTPHKTRARRKALLMMFERCGLQKQPVQPQKK